MAYQTTYERVMSMPAYTKNEWTRNALLFGLACSCRSNDYCAQHDPKLQDYLQRAKEQIAKETQNG